MKGIYFNGKNAEYHEDIPKPQRKRGYSLIRIQRAAICNTDKEVLKGYRPDFRGVMGHEFVGVVEDSDKTELVGKTVVGELNEGCGECLYCKTGHEKHCPQRKVIGMEGRDGCFGEYMLLADHLVHAVPDGLPIEKAIYTEPLAAALEIPTQVHISPEKTVAIIGDGRLAFMIVQVLSLNGCDLTIIGKHKEKLDKFQQYGHMKLLEEVAEHPTIEETYDIIVDATGTESGILLAQRLIRRCGTIVLKSTYAHKASLDMSQFVVNEITIVGSRCGPFEPALQLLKKGLVEFPEIEWYDLKEYEEAFHSLAFKVGFRISD